MCHETPVILGESLLVHLTQLRKYAFDIALLVEQRAQQGLVSSFDIIGSVVRRDF